MCELMLGKGGKECSESRYIFLRISYNIHAFTYQKNRSGLIGSFGNLLIFNRKVFRRLLSCVEGS